MTMTKTHTSVWFNGDPRVLSVHLPNDEVWEAIYDSTGKRTWKVSPSPSNQEEKEKEQKEEEKDDADDDHHPYVDLTPLANIAARAVNELQPPAPEAAIETVFKIPSE